MIYVLDINSWPFDPMWPNNKEPFQYITLEYFVKDFLFKEQPTHVHKIENGSSKISIETVDKILSENTNIKIFACNLDAFEDKQSLLLYDEILCNKYPNIFFIFFYHELDFTFLVDNKSRSIRNIMYVINSFSTNDYEELNNKIFPYYLINSYLQKNYESMYKMYHPNYNLRKIKKYNFLNGIHKPHRFAAYQLIKKHDMLDDGFFSYLDYTKFLKDEHYIKQTADWLNMDKDEFVELAKQFEVPYLLETYEPQNQPGLFAAPFLIPQIYSWQSYISITSETNYIESSNIVSLSEKSFKAFAGFNIPLIYGQPFITEYLKKLGFDMFDDLFDNTVTMYKPATLEKLDKNLQVIKNMSLEELHNFYVKNYDRIKNNFYNLIYKLKDNHFNEINKNVNAICNK